jgi:hypothetical protein
MSLKNETDDSFPLEQSIFTRQQGRRWKKTLIPETASLFLAKCVTAKDNNEILEAEIPTIIQSMEDAYSDWKRQTHRSNEWPDRDREFLAAVTNLARYLGYRANFRDRVEWGMRALDVAERLDDKAAEVELCASIISWPLLQMGDLARAETYSQKGYDLAVDVGKWREAALAARTLSGIYRDRSTEQPGSNAEIVGLAQKWAGRAYLCARRAGDRDLRLSAIFDHANAAMLSAASWRRAERGYRVVVADFERRSPRDVERLASRLGDLGHALICQGKDDEAEVYYRRSEDVLQSFESPIIRAELTFNSPPSPAPAARSPRRKRLPQPAKRRSKNSGSSGSPVSINI